MNSKNELKVNMLSAYEQNIQQLLTKKQTLNTQILEIESALKETENSEEVYKIIGNIMIKSNKEKTIKELNEKKEILELRIKSINEQENKIKEKSDKLQKEILEEMNQKK